MAAPSTTKWGSIVGSYGRIGVNVSLSSTSTTTTATVQIWFWSKYSVSDTANTLYFDNLSSSGSASTSRGTVSVSTSVDSGSGWSTSNQQLLKTYTYEYTRGTSASTRYLYAKFINVDRVGGTMYSSTTFSVPKLATYTVSYNANGGSGAPSSQTKYYGKSLKLSTTKPTRTGYTFQGWATSSSGSVAYASGATYTANSSVTLYAKWKAITYTVSYNANGGSGAPSSQTKTYGVNLTLSSTKPTRANYTFKGWGTSKSATTVSYTAGATYSKNAAVTLYAIWQLAYKKPRITNLSVIRSNSSGTASDSGTYAKVSFNWACDKTISSILIEWESETGGSGSKSVTATGTSGSVSQVIGNNTISTDANYTIKITVTDASGYTSAVVTISGTSFTMDLLSGGKGIAFGKPAELTNVLDVGFKTRFTGGLLYVVLEPETNLNNIRTPGFYVGANVSTNNYTNCPITSGTFTLEVISSGESGQVLQRLTKCHKTETDVYERFYYSSAWGSWTGGWIYPTLTSNFSMYGTSTADNQVRYRKNGQTVEVRGIVTPSSDIAYSTNVIPIFTLAEGYRPSSPIYIMCQGSGNCVWFLRVTSGGEVGFSRYRNGSTNTTATAGTWLPFQVTFFNN